MKKEKMKEKWLCQLCGMVNEYPEHHVNTHRHKSNMKKIEDAASGSMIKRTDIGRRWE